jgi:hypothetical protein
MFFQWGCLSLRTVNEIRGVGLRPLGVCRVDGNSSLKPKGIVALAI